MFGSLIEGHQDHSNILDKMQQLAAQHDEKVPAKVCDTQNYKPLSLESIKKEDISKDIQGERVPTLKEQDTFKQLSSEMSKLLDRQWDIPPRCKNS